MEEIRKIADRAAEQLATYPAVTGKEKVKRLIKAGLLRQKLAPADSFSWPNAMLGEGLLAAFEATGEKRYLQAVADYLNRWKKAGYPIHYVDNIMNGWLALWISSLLDGSCVKPLCNLQQRREMKELCLEVQEACADWVRAAAKTERGILPYRNHHPGWGFADTLGMVCPFLCRYGAEHSDKELLRQGIGQLLLFQECGMDPVTGLPYHGYEEKTGMKYGIIGWGRACGWMMKGLAESLPWIPAEEKGYQELLTLFRQLSCAVMKYQRPDGGFSWQLEALEGHCDTSAEGMIGAALIRGLKSGLLRDEKNAPPSGMQEKTQSILTGLTGAVCASLEDGVVKNCSGECTGFAEYPQRYGSYPWGTGSVLEFLSYHKR